MTSDGEPPISAARRAFSRTFSATQRDTPSRRSRRNVTGLEVVVGEAPVDAAGERRGRGGSSRLTWRALCGYERKFRWTPDLPQAFAEERHVGHSVGLRPRTR